ncbi:MAG: hypothetical protein IJL67_10605 [Oscillospiraceae bacterium]|nr:hypothetical protein [Oscillospiraceae bacterium]
MNRKKRLTAGVISAVFALTTLAFPMPGGRNKTISAEETPEPAASFSAADVTPAVTEAEAAALPSRFDLREKGLVSSVKDQGTFGTCWTFAASGALETALIKNEPFIDLSEMHLAYFSFYGDNTPESPEKDPEKFISGGHVSYAAASYARWFGPVKEAILPYSSKKEEIDPALQNRQDYFVTDMSILNPYTLKETDKDDMVRFSDDEIKQMLYDGNSVAVNICYENTYNEETFAQYDPSGGQTNHGVLIVGWDDNYSSRNFLYSPPRDGAWIVKNSWGNDWGDNGYFYVSYYDKSIADACCLKAEKTGRYQTNYQHDELFCTAAISPDRTSRNSGYMANIFTAQKDEFITGTGFYTTDNNAEYEITVYTDLKDLNDPTSGVPNKVQCGTEKYAGYHTIALDDPVKVSKGEKFAVAVGLKNPGTNCPLPVEAAVVLMENRFAVNVSEISEEEIEDGTGKGESFISVNGTRWTDTQGMEIEDVYNNPKMPDSNVKYYVGNVCLKAFGSDSIGAEPETPVKTKSVLSSLTVNKDEISLCDENEEPLTELYTEITGTKDYVTLVPSGTGTIKINGEEIISGHESEPVFLDFGENIVTITSEENGLEPTEYTLTIMRNRAAPDYINEVIVFDQDTTSVVSADGYEFKSGESISDHLGKELIVTEPDREYTIELEPRRDIGAAISEDALYVEGEVITGLFGFKGTMNYSFEPDMYAPQDIHNRMTSLLGENAFRVYPNEDTDLYFQIAATEKAPKSTIWHIHIPYRPTITSGNIDLTIPQNNRITFMLDYAEGAVIQYRLTQKYSSERPGRNDLYPYKTMKNGDIESIEDLLPGQTYSLYYKLISNGKDFASDIQERVITLPGGAPICSFNCEKERIIFNEKKYIAYAPDGQELRCYDQVSDYCGEDVILIDKDGNETSVLVPVRRDAPYMTPNYRLGYFEGYYQYDTDIKYVVNAAHACDSTQLDPDQLMDSDHQLRLDKIFSSSYRPGDTLSFFHEATETEFVSECYMYIIPEQPVTPKESLKILNYSDTRIELAASDDLEYSIRSDLKDEFTWGYDPVFEDLEPDTSYIVAVRKIGAYNKPYGTAASTFITTLPADHDAGDLNGDKAVTAIDLLIMKRILLMNIEPDPLQKMNGDLNSDGVINVFDMQRLSQNIVA